MILPKAEQFEILRKGRGFSNQRYGSEEEASKFFDITKDEWIEWSLNEPIPKWIFTEKGPSDGSYFVKEGDFWLVYWQDRGMIDYRYDNFFKSTSYHEARVELAKREFPWELFYAEKRMMGKNA